MHGSDFVPLDQGSICVQRGEQRICLRMLILIYNMRARVGINQICNTYTKHLDQNANTDVFF